MIFLQVFVIVCLATVVSCDHDLEAAIVEEDELATAQFRYGGKSYQNRWDLPLHVECNARNGEALNEVRSVFHGHYRDRLWHWGCKKASNTPLTECSWTDYVNNWQQPIRFMCPKGKIMAGIDSRHWNAKEDRRWKIKCCSAKDYHTEDCELTKYLNTGKTFFEHKATETNKHKSQCSRKSPKEEDHGAFFSGMVSNWRSNDRKWQLIECEFVKDAKKQSKRRYSRRYRRRHGIDDDDDDSSKSSRSKSTRSKSHDRSHDRSRAKSRSKSCSGGKCGGSRDRSKSDSSKSKSRSRNRRRRNKGCCKKQFGHKRHG